MLSHNIHLAFYLLIYLNNKELKMLQSFEIWCENCVKTTYYENEKIFNDEDFVKINNSIFCKSCAHKIINEK